MDVEWEGPASPQSVPPEVVHGKADELAAMYGTGTYGTCGNVGSCRQCKRGAMQARLCRQAPSHFCATQNGSAAAHEARSSARQALSFLRCPKRAVWQIADEVV